MTLDRPLTQKEKDAIYRKRYNERHRDAIREKKRLERQTDEYKVKRRAYLAANRHRQAIYDKGRDRAKMRARKLLQVKIKRGTQTRLPCEVCGGQESEAHHVCYDLPYAVTWLCKEHHQEIHREHRG